MSSNIGDLGGFFFFSIDMNKSHRPFLNSNILDNLENKYFAEKDRVSFS